jgi:phosphatidylinositol alpha-mannosyltransferase
VPDARFQLSGNVRPDRQAALLAYLDERDRQYVEFLGVGGQSDLPALYRNASVTVLPAIWEAFGLALAESLACGTPVVGCRHAGIKDIVSSPEVGRLFNPGTLRGEASNRDGLARAMIEALELARTPSTAAACRRRAEEFGWDRLGPAIQELYSA